MLNVGIIGATGYAGQELIRLLHGHPEVRLKKLMSESFKDMPLHHVYRNFFGHLDQLCLPIDYETAADGLDVLFCALPYGVLMAHMTEELLGRVRLIDLGVDYRLMDVGEYRACYGKEHLTHHLSTRFVYGLSEWNERAVASASHIANPGCYATAMELALLPLLSEGLIEPDIVVDGKCAMSGAGRTLSLGTHFTEANDSTKPYKITKHPHRLEMQKAASLFAGTSVNLTFVPHMVPMQRGLLVTCYATPQAPLSRRVVQDAYQARYDSCPFVCVLDEGMYVETKWVRGSNMCHINFEIDEENNRLIVMAAIDNLVKGAAGQAIQNLNIMCGYPQDTALTAVPACL